VCKALKPRKPQPRTAESSSVIIYRFRETETPSPVDIPHHLLESLRNELKDDQLARHLLALYETVISFVKRTVVTTQNEATTEELFSTEKKQIVKENFGNFRQFKTGLFDVRFKFSDSDSNILRTALANHYIICSVLSVNSQRKLAVAEGATITIADPTGLLEESNLHLDNSSKYTISLRIAFHQSITSISLEIKFKAPHLFTLQLKNWMT